jgi:hypothetical protein
MSRARCPPKVGKTYKFVPEKEKVYTCFFNKKRIIGSTPLRATKSLREPCEGATSKVLGSDGERSEARGNLMG